MFVASLVFDRKLKALTTGRLRDRERQVHYGKCPDNPGLYTKFQHGGNNDYEVSITSDKSEHVYVVSVESPSVHGMQRKREVNYDVFAQQER